mmetsp:Transcript_49289/g.130605  ORF Transcript_49289/g.130605 Transcript_49289/m.130605 type:complete len:367 (-) Transcript_49289:365-1465(-)
MQPPQNEACELRWTNKRNARRLARILRIDDACRRLQAHRGEVHFPVTCLLHQPEAAQSHNVLPGFSTQAGQVRAIRSGLAVRGACGDHGPREEPGSGPRCDVSCVVLGVPLRFQKIPEDWLHRLLLKQSKLLLPTVHDQLKIREQFLRFLALATQPHVDVVRVVPERRLQDVGHLVQTAKTNGDKQGNHWCHPPCCLHNEEGPHEYINDGHDLRHLCVRQRELRCFDSFHAPEIAHQRVQLRIEIGHDGRWAPANFRDASSRKHHPVQHHCRVGVRKRGFGAQRHRLGIEHAKLLLVSQTPYGFTKPILHFVGGPGLHARALEELNDHQEVDHKKPDDPPRMSRDFLVLVPLKHAHSDHCQGSSVL